MARMFLFNCLIIASFSVSINALTSQELGEFKSRTHTESNTNLQGTVSVDSSSNANNHIITSNGIPDHTTGTFPQAKTNPNSIEKQTFRFFVPKIPKIASESSCLTFGPIAVSKNGIPLFNPHNINGDNAVEGDTAEVFDNCDGHPDMRGVYHYHQTPDCLYDNTNDEFIGVALDGFPIYGIKNSTGQEMTSKDLDQCHGHVYNGEYRYRLTRDYPYIMGCFKGTRANQGGRTPPEDCTKGSKASGIHAFPFQTSFLLPIVIGMVIQMVSK